MDQQKPMMKHSQRQFGFTAVELLITLFVAAAFLIASYQLFNLVIKDGGATRSESRAANIAYDYLRQYAATSTTIPCTASTPLNNAPISVDGLIETKISISVTCLPDAINSLSKVEAVITYNVPAQTVKYATYVSSAGSSNAADVTNGLVTWWKLNGDANSSIGFNNSNGTISNATSTSNQAGQSDKAYSFNGSNSSIDIGSTLSLGAANVTISLWVYNPTANNSGAFFKIGGGSNGYGMGIGTTYFDNASGNGPKLIMLYEGVRWITTSTNVGAGWHHVVMVIDGSGIPTAYVDGVSAGTYAGAAPAAPTANKISIGANTTATARYFNGSIDDVRIYSRPLPTSEILTLYSAGAK